MKCIMEAIQPCSLNIQTIPGIQITYPGHPFINWNKVIEHRTNLDNLSGRLIKKVVDIILASLVVLLLLTWIIPLIALCIKIDSSGPLFFLQKRKGFLNRPFTCIKFRSMYINGESNKTPVQERDSRITPFGKFLRKYHLDELPQFINVLLGNMSIVGPRPHMILENNYYERVIKNYSFRYKARPGITGLGQINNRRQVSDRVKMENRIFWDMLYIKNWSQYLDIWIIIKTFFFCIKAENNFKSS